MRENRIIIILFKPTMNKKIIRINIIYNVTIIVEKPVRTMHFIIITINIRNKSSTKERGEYTLFKRL